MNKATSQRYVNLMDIYINHIVDTANDKKHADRYYDFFYPFDEDDKFAVIAVTKRWLLNQFNKVLLHHEVKEEYEVCTAVFKHINKLEKLKD